MNLSKSKGEFNFNMFENSDAKLQYQARHHEDSQAVGGLHYEIKSMKKLTKKQRKNQRYRSNLKTKALAGCGGLGVTADGG